MDDRFLFPGRSESLSVKDAIAEANRCLNCKSPKCVTGCPISNDIPEFIAALGRGNIGEAREIIARKSNLPAVCGRVCAHELQCEGHCIMHKAGKGIKVGKLEQFIADFTFEMEIPLDKVPQKTHGKVAVIGSGPAGLTVAGDLAKIGYKVTVYEAMPEPGGVLLYGIPSFRLPKEVVRREIARIEMMGVVFVNNCIIGETITVDELFADGYDAMFIGSGTARPKMLDIPGKDLDGVIHSSYLLRMHYLYTSGQLSREEVPIQKGEDVIIIGAGNVGMDAARTAIRLGAETVTVMYRGDEAGAPALRAEYDAAVAEGVKFVWKTSPTAYLGEDGQLTGVKVLTEGEEKIIPTKKVFLAVGSQPANRIVSTTYGIDVDQDGYVVVKDRPYGMTTRKGVFAGGDVVHRPATVVLAMKEAKHVAQGISAYIEAVKLLA